MKFLHQPFKAKCRNIIRIHFSIPTQVKLIHEDEFLRYKSGKTYQFNGGFFSESPAEFEVPFNGTWHAVVEKGTHFSPLEVEARAEMLSPRLQTLNGNLEMETHEAISLYDDTLE